ncbi:MAG: DUF1501 domain-containing protein [Chloroflexota bacterium]
MVALSRRSFLSRGATLIAAGMAVPSFIAETARQVEQRSPFASTASAAGRRILVMIQLAGGADGINMLVPYGDPAYYSPTIRPGLAIPHPSSTSGSPKVLPIDNYVGFHPSFSRLKSRYDRGMVACIQGVSYPNPNRSHFRGMDIWESAVPTRLEAKGWMGRYLEVCGCQRADHLEALSVGSSSVPGTFWTDLALVPAVASLSTFRYTSVNNGSTSQRNAEIQALRNGLTQTAGLPEQEFLRQSILTALTDADILQAAGSAYTPVGIYPANGLGNAMKLTAQLIVADVGTSIFFVSQGGYDTHSDQNTALTSLVNTLDQSIEGFLIDMEAAGRLNDVVLMTFSEFGRRLGQNGSAGSDHGVAAPMYVIGGPVNGGRHGTYPSLTDLTQGDLKMQVDFRSVYATVLQNWLSFNPTGVLEGSFPLMNFINTTCLTGRPSVAINTFPVGPDRLQVNVAPSGAINGVRSISFTRVDGGTVDVGTQSGLGTGASVTFPPGTLGVSFFINRSLVGSAATAQFTVVDACGSWPTFAGGGSSPWAAGAPGAGARSVMTPTSVIAPPAVSSPPTSSRANPSLTMTPAVQQLQRP